MNWINIMVKIELYVLLEQACFLILCNQSCLRLVMLFV